MSDFITIPEASKLLQRKPRHVYQLIKQGKLEKYKQLGKSFVLRRDVLELLVPKPESESAAVS